MISDAFHLAVTSICKDDPFIAEREEDFAHGFSEHLIGYGLGRPFGFTDVDLADEIVNAAKEEDFAVSAFVQALVGSEAFQKK